MKFNKLFLGAALLSMGVFTSCSNDDEPANNGGQGNVKGDGYIAVKFQTAGLGGSRAAGEGFEDGSEAEGKVEAGTTRFYFFDIDGNPFRMADAGNINGNVYDGDGEADNMVTPLEIKTGNTDGNVAVDGMLVLGKGTNGYEGLVPYQAVCVSNGDETFMNGLANKSLTDLAMEVAKGDGNLFMMSNSNYKEALKMGAVTIGDKIKSTPEQANADPVDFYLERLAVKVRIKIDQEKVFTAQEATATEGQTSYSDAVYSIYQADGSVKKVNLKVVLADWLLVKTTDNARTIKQLPATDPWTNWSDAAYHRSYWAVSSAESVNKPYFDIYNVLTTDEEVNTAWTDLGSTGLYTWEWTGATNVDSENDRDHNANATSVVIRAHVKENVAAEGETANWKNIDLVKWAGTYYTLDAFKQQVVNTYNAGKADNKVNVADVELVYVGGNDAGNGKGGNDNYWKVQVEGSDYTQYTNIKYWKDGVTSFYLNIKHANDDAGKNVYGVVRNHIYEYSIDKIVGLGVPGNNPDQEAGETFVSASLNVLNWKVVSNSVTLQ